MRKIKNLANWPERHPMMKKKLTLGMSEPEYGSSFTITCSEISLTYVNKHTHGSLTYVRLAGILMGLAMAYMAKVSIKGACR